MQQTKKPRFPKRKATDFPINENVPCWLSKATNGVFSRKDNIPLYWYIDILHGTKRPDLTMGKEGKELTRYFKDRYFFNYDGDEDEGDKYHPAKHTLNFILSSLGGDKVSSDLTYQNFVKEATKALNKLKGTEYYLKTRLILNEYRNTYFLNRGIRPFISKTPTMRYERGEDKHHRYVLFGRKKFEELNEQRQQDGKDRYK